MFLLITSRWSMWVWGRKRKRSTFLRKPTRNATATTLHLLRPILFSIRSAVIRALRRSCKTFWAGNNWPTHQIVLRNVKHRGYGHAFPAQGLPNWTLRLVIVLPLVTAIEPQFVNVA